MLKEQDGGLPASPEFYDFVVFLKADEVDKDGNKVGGDGFKVVLNHLRKLELETGEGSDDENQKFTRMMLDILSAMLHIGRCKDRGSTLPPHHEQRTQAREEVENLQALQFSLERPGDNSQSSSEKLDPSMLAHQPDEKLDP